MITAPREALVKEFLRSGRGAHRREMRAGAHSIYYVNFDPKKKEEPLDEAPQALG
jgi:hypothetical protein